MTVLSALAVIALVLGVLVASWLLIVAAAAGLAWLTVLFARSV